MSLEIHRATAADANDLLFTMNEAHQFKLSKGDMAWETHPFSPEEIAGMIARDTCYAVSVDSKAAVESFCSGMTSIHGVSKD